MAGGDGFYSDGLMNCPLLDESTRYLYLFTLPAASIALREEFLPLITAPASS